MNALAPKPGMKVFFVHVGVSDKVHVSTAGTVSPLWDGDVLDGQLPVMVPYGSTSQRSIPIHNLGTLYVPGGKPTLGRSDEARAWGGSSMVCLEPHLEECRRAMVGEAARVAVEALHWMADRYNEMFIRLNGLTEGQAHCYAEPSPQLKNDNVTPDVDLTKEHVGS